MQDLLGNHVFLLALIIVLGYLLGRIQIRSFSLGASAVIFVALVFGHFGYSLPEEFQTLGLVLFIYSIALQAGPGFLSSFRKGGLYPAIGALVVVLVGLLVTLACARLFRFESGMAAGLFAGALTSTPGLAVAVEATGGGLAPAAYGVAYTFGVIGVILFVKLLPLVMKFDIAGEEARLEQELRAGSPPVIFHHFELTNPNLFNKTVREVAVNRIAEVSITRVLRKGATKPELATGNTVLRRRDHLRVVGREEDLEKVRLFIGKRVHGEIEFDSALATRRIVVTNARVIGETPASLNLRTVYNVELGHITRSGFDIPAKPHMQLNRGDVLHLVGMEESLHNVEELLGNNMQELYTASVIPIVAGILLGFLAGKIPLYLPGVGLFTLGTTGGALCAGLILSHLKKTGPLVWDIPPTANSFIRELGLLLFLATVGVSAGGAVVETLKRYGLTLFASGILVTFLPLVIAFAVCRTILKIQFLRTLGVLTGGMTSTPGLAAVASVSETPHASTVFATVYPIALVGMILAVKLLVWLMRL